MAVMRGERGPGVEPRGGGPRETVGGDEGAGAVLRAVDPVGIASKGPDARRAGEPMGSPCAITSGIDLNRRARPAPARKNRRY